MNATKQKEGRYGLCHSSSDICVQSSSASPAGARAKHFGRSYPRTMHLIASNRSVRICANPAIVDGAPSWSIASGRICRISFPSAGNWLSVRRLFNLLPRYSHPTGAKTAFYLSLSRSPPIFTNDEIKCRRPIQIANIRAIYLITANIRENL